MSAQEFKIIYEFTSTKADGDSYTRSLTVKAKDSKSALSVARIEGFRAFGARFNDNCIDWRISSSD